MDEARFHLSFTWDQYIRFIGTFSLRSTAWEQVIEVAWLPWTGRCSPTLLIDTTTRFPNRLAGWSRRLEIPSSAFAMILTVRRLCPQCLCGRVLRHFQIQLIQCAVAWRCVGRNRRCLCISCCEGAISSVWALIQTVLYISMWEEHCNVNRVHDVYCVCIEETWAWDAMQYSLQCFAGSFKSTLYSPAPNKVQLLWSQVYQVPWCLRGLACDRLTYTHSFPWGLQGGPLRNVAFLGPTSSHGIEMEFGVREAQIHLCCVYFGMIATPWDILRCGLCERLRLLRTKASRSLVNYWKLKIEISDKLSDSFH